MLDIRVDISQIESFPLSERKELSVATKCLIHLLRMVSDMGLGLDFCGWQLDIQGHQQPDRPVVGTPPVRPTWNLCPSTAMALLTSQLHLDWGGP